MMARNGVLNMRQAQYTTDKLHRIISLPGNMWQFQANINEARGTRTIDPWQKRSHAITLGEAQAMLRSAQPARKVGA